MTKITNFQLFTILVFWVLFDVLILICWLSVSPYYLNPIGNYCESKQGELFTIIILVIRSFQIFAGSYLTYEVRGVILLNYLNFYFISFLLSSMNLSF